MNENGWLDRAIDEVACELTDREPRPGLAVQIAGRLDQAERSRTWVWQLAGAAGALVVALIVWLALPARTVTPISSPRPQLADRVLSLQREERAGVQIAKGEQRAPRGRSRRTEVLRIAIDPDAPKIPALPELAELRVAVPDPGTLTVAALEMRDLDVIPLTSDDKEPR